MPRGIPNSRKPKPDADPRVLDPTPIPQAQWFHRAGQSLQLVYRGVPTDTFIRYEPKDQLHPFVACVGMYHELGHGGIAPAKAWAEQMFLDRQVFLV